MHAFSKRSIETDVYSFTSLLWVRGRKRAALLVVAHPATAKTVAFSLCREVLKTQPKVYCDFTLYT